jgi:type I restriction enzyme S subunit
MSDRANATVKVNTRPLGSLVLIDPESLPLGTPPDFSFGYVDIASVTDGRLRLPESEIEYRNAPSRARRVIRNGDVLMSTVRPNLKLLLTVTCRPAPSLRQPDLRSFAR